MFIGIILIALIASQNSTIEYSCNNIIKLEEQVVAKDGEGFFVLARCYQEGEGVTKDLSKAVEYYQKSADQNYTLAQSNLGIMYINGDGVTQDSAKAIEYFQKAADQNNAIAQYNLGIIHEYGKGVVEDLAKAIGVGLYHSLLFQRRLER